MNDFEQCTQADVVNALQYLSSDVCRDDWVKIGMAIKSEFPDAFDIFDAWSSDAKSYKPRDCKATWKSIRIAGAGGSVRIGTLFQAAIARGYKPSKKELTADEKVRFPKERAAREARRVFVEAEEQAEIAAWHKAVADVVPGIISGLASVGQSEYLKHKQVGGHGIYYVSHGLVVLFSDDEVKVELVYGQSNIAAFFKNKGDDVSFLYLKKGCVVVPVYDESYTPVNLQIIYSKGKKLFLKHGRKAGCFSVLGDVSVDSDLVIFAEGYATAASIFEATGHAVVVTFDCGNILAVVGEFRRQYPNVRFVIAADDDRETKGNPGVTKAREAIERFGGFVAVPVFSDAGSEVANG